MKYQIQIEEWTIGCVMEIEADSPEEAAKRMRQAMDLSREEWIPLEITHAVEWGHPMPTYVMDKYGKRFDCDEDGHIIQDEEEE